MKRFSHGTSQGCSSTTLEDLRSAQGTEDLLNRDSGPTEPEPLAGETLLNDTRTAIQYIRNERRPVVIRQGAMWLAPWSVIVSRLTMRRYLGRQ